MEDARKYYETRFMRKDDRLRALVLHALYVKYGYVGTY